MKEFNFYFSLFLGAGFSLFITALYQLEFWQSLLLIPVFWFLFVLVGEIKIEEEENKQAIAHAAKLYIERENNVSI